MTRESTRTWIVALVVFCTSAGVGVLLRGYVLQRGQVRSEAASRTAGANPIESVVTTGTLHAGSATGLTRLRVNASLAPADIGRVQRGQAVILRVDAYPSEQFTGRVVDIAVLTKNVVTSYVAVIDAQNPELKLKPGMKVTVAIEVVRPTPDLRALNATRRLLKSIGPGPKQART
jgi:hypothetical protein